MYKVTVAYKALLREAKRREERPTSTRSNNAEKENVREPDTPKPRCSPSLKSWFFGGEARSQNTKRPRKDDNTTSSHSSPNINEKSTRSSPRRAHFEPEPSTSHYSQSVPSGSQRSYTHTTPSYTHTAQSGSQRSYAHSTTDSHDSSGRPRKRLRKDRPPASRQNT